MIRSLGALGALAAIAGLGVAQALSPPSPVLIWNASASVPIGLYTITVADRLHRGDLVAIRAPEPLAGWLADGGYLPLGVPLLKHVAAGTGHHVCRLGRQVSVDGVTTATALDRDGRGHPLPVWRGCSTLGPGEFFALNPAAPDSLDSRYFGPLPTSSVIGRARPLWLPQATGAAR